MTEEIRQIIANHGRLSVDAAELAPDADLYHAGMTSHASMMRLTMAGTCDSMKPIHCSGEPNGVMRPPPENA